MLILLFAFWLLLNGRWTTEIAVTGAVISLLIYLLAWKFFGFSVKRELALAKRTGKAFSYGCWLIGQVFISAFQTMRFIWSPKEIVEPRLTSFRTRVKSEGGRVILANSITLTPGTFTVAIRDDKFLIHRLDDTFSDDLADSEMERRILKIEGEVHHG